MDPQTGHTAKKRAGAARPLVELHGLVKCYGETTAVDGVSLNIAEGEFFALLGPSGCGKTTLLRLLAGFETPDEGVISLAGADISHVPPYRRPVNMMFQSYALFPHMSVEQNIAFGLKQDKLAKEDVAARVADMLRLVQLTGLGRRRPDQLSGGQRQRVALARALAKRPRLVLLDEPLAALDKKLRQETQFELLHIQKELGVTFVIVTHDQEEAMTIADRIAVMRDGRIAQIGPPREVYEAPATRYVADFIGEVNLIETVVASSAKGRLKLKSTETGTEIVAAADAARDPGATVWLSLRPEKIRIAKAKPADGANSVAGTIIDIAYLGDLSIYRVRLASGKVLKSSQANATRVRAGGLAAGDSVHLSWTADAGVVVED